jgi:hypothetical protein
VVTVKGQKNRYNIKLLSGYGITIKQKENKSVSYSYPVNLLLQDALKNKSILNPIQD